MIYDSIALSHELRSLKQEVIGCNDDSILHMMSLIYHFYYDKFFDMVLMDCLPDDCFGGLHKQVDAATRAYLRGRFPYRQWELI